MGNKVKKSTVIVQYEIQVSNTGTKAGQVTEIRDYIPSNMTFVAEDNPGWALKDNYAYMLINETLQPGQTTSRTITLRWYGNSNEMGLISNVATVNGEENIIPEQQGKSEITISVKTGTITYIALGIIILGIIGGGTYIVKKYIVTDEEKSE